MVEEKVLEDNLKEIADTVTKSLEGRMDDMLNERVSKSQMVQELVGGEAIEHNSVSKTIKLSENFVDYLAKGSISKTLSTLVPADGGYLVPDNWYDRIITRARELSPIRENANLSTISVGNSLLVPVEGDDDFATGWISETGDRDQTDSGNFGQKEISVHELYANPKTTRAVLMDTAYDLEGYIIEKIAEQFALVEGTAFVNGDGSGKPYGLLHETEGITDVTVTTAKTDEIAYGELVEMVYGIKSKYAKNGKWYMNRETVGYLQGIADTTGQPLYRPSTIVGQPATMLGYPIVEVDAMEGFKSDGTTADEDIILFGDMSKAYVVVDRNDIGLQRDDITVKGFVQFYAYKRVGGRVVLPEALAKMRVNDGL